jgi:arsenate reductase
MNEPMKESERPPSAVSPSPRRVLFLCIYNSARSQIAEGVARRLAPPGVEIWSAGGRPAEINPLAIQVLEEIGIDPSRQRSKRIDEVPWREVDTVVTLCEEGEIECPVFPASARRLYWPMPDPYLAPPERRLEAFRATRDALLRRIASLWPERSRD